MCYIIAMEQTTPVEKTKMQSFWELVRFALIALVIVIPIRLFIAEPFVVSGTSMVPTFQNGDYLIVDKISYELGNPHRGDVVVFRYPKNPSQFFIKRVIGLPGETVDITNGQVEIVKDGKTTVLDEKYLPADLKTYIYDNSGISPLPEEVTLKSDQYFVLGDNRGESLDSRIFGPVNRDLLIGRTWIRGWPFDRITVFNTPIYK